MAYNLTAIGTNTTDTVTFLQSVNNELLGGMMGLMWIIGIAVVLFTGFQFATGSVKKSLVASSFICGVLSILLRGMDLMSDTVMFTAIIVAAITIFIALALNWD